MSQCRLAENNTFYRSVSQSNAQSSAKKFNYYWGGGSLRLLGVLCVYIFETKFSN